MQKRTFVFIIRIIIKRKILKKFYAILNLFLSFLRHFYFIRIVFVQNNKK